MTWDLDEEWNEYDLKTMRVVQLDGTILPDTVFSGSTCSLPVVTVPGVVQIGLYAGDIRTSRMAVMRALSSALTHGGAPADPPESVYNQLMERMAQLEDPDAVRYSEQTLTDAQKSQARDNIGALDKYKGLVPTSIPFNSKEWTIYVEKGNVTAPESMTDEVKAAFQPLAILSMNSVSLTHSGCQAACKKLLTLAKSGVFGENFLSIVSENGADTPGFLAWGSMNPDISKRAYISCWIPRTGYFATRLATGVTGITVFYDVSNDKPATSSDYGTIVLTQSLNTGTGTYSMQQVEMAADPATDMQIATKKYVDDTSGKNCVLYAEQTLTDDQKAQARENINALQQRIADPNTLGGVMPLWHDGDADYLKSFPVGVVQDTGRLVADLKLLQRPPQVEYIYHESKNSLFDCGGLGAAILTNTGSSRPDILIDISCPALFWFGKGSRGRYPYRAIGADGEIIRGVMDTSVADPNISVETIDGLTINSSTEGSTKKFRITVDDSGTVSATEVTT